MMELNLLGLAPAGNRRATMEHNISHKFESQFVGLTVPANNSVMFGSLSGYKLGIWVAHGEGRFNLPGALSDYNVIAKFNYASYPANPNGSRGSCCRSGFGHDGRHVAIMPHLERAIFPWQAHIIRPVAVTTKSLPGSMHLSTRASGSKISSNGNSQHHTTGIGARLSEVSAIPVFQFNNKLKNKINTH